MQQAQVATAAPVMTGELLVAANPAEQPMAVVDVVKKIDDTVLPSLDFKEIERATSIAQTIDVRNGNYVAEYAKDAQSKIASFSDTVLAQVRSSDSGEIGEKLTGILMSAKRLNVGSLKDGQSFFSKLPVIGRMFDNVEKFKMQFDDINQQIDQTLEQLTVAKTSAMTRNMTLDELYKHNVAHYKELVVYIAAGEMKINELNSVEIPMMEADVAASNNDPLKAAELSDLKKAAGRFERKVYNLKTARMSALQKGPEIRLIQSNNQSLVEKIQDTINLAIPSWKSTFVISIALLEQKKGAALDKMVTDATQDFMIAGAKMLNENSIEIAKAQQRGIIDIETLETTQKYLLNTLEEVSKIEKDGKQKRADSEKRMVQLETELKQKLIAG